ncbi:antibiotic biosynthesis monooxygenase [Mesorhizobium sp. B2-3-5]|uniref:antibiotic biosynthesis monooxygenase n=1 Tax=Mesorhizobium sp. B2-3-5 TaxID=2589958 RepID=UPI001FED44EC|nr:antibiotic biosynthesis monooxygenase [Mesorhizobium sp. B2-3-5]
MAGAQSLVAAETGTRPGSRYLATFAIFDTFDNEAGRDAHLAGEVAAAPMTHADELLATTPEIRKAHVLADKLPA